jgi:hypothetical protein
MHDSGQEEDVVETVDHDVTEKKCPSLIVGVA